MPRYKSFLELTGDAEMAKDLEDLYGDIDALEFYPGEHLENDLFGRVNFKCDRCRFVTGES